MVATSEHNFKTFSEIYQTHRFKFHKISFYMSHDRQIDSRQIEKKDRDQERNKQKSKREDKLDEMKAFSSGWKILSWRKKE